MIHYVDDYGCVEPEPTIGSSFQYTHETLRTIGFRFKQSKMQPPGHTQKIQGITMSITEKEFLLLPTENRLDRIIETIQKILQDQQISADEACKLAGKLQFLQEATAGQGIRACIHPLWKLATSYSYHKKLHNLPPGVADALQTILLMIPMMKPRRAPFTPSMVAIVYADAYFLAGEKVIRLADAADDW
eukprot:Skav229268  [mRNA]  locus=scaffold952:181971:182537:- [translate_table: standard]